MNRRRFLGAAAAYLSVPQLATRPSELRARTRLILLGPTGGPRPRAARSAPAQAIVVDDTAYVVDCGAFAWARGSLTTGFHLTDAANATR